MNTIAKSQVVRQALTYHFGHKAMIAAAAALCNRTSFSLGMALLRPERTVAFDDAMAAFYGVEKIETVQLSPETLSSGFVAAQFLLVDGINKPDPENGGKRNTWALKYFRTGKDIVGNVTDWMVRSRIRTLEANAAAIAAVTGTSPDLTKRREAIKREVGELVKDQIDQIDALIKQAIVAHKGLTGEDAVELVFDCLDAMEQDPGQIVADSVDRMVAGLKARMEAGEFAMLDTGVFAMAQALGLTATTKAVAATATAVALAKTAAADPAELSKFNTPAQG